MPDEMLFRFNQWLDKINKGKKKLLKKMKIKNQRKNQRKPPIRMPTITKDEIEFLKENNAIEGEYRDVALEDAKDAWALAKRYSGNIDFEFILHIHRQLMKSINPAIAGNIREQPVYVGNRTKGYRECLDYKLIRTEIDKLCIDWSNSRLDIENSNYTGKKEKERKEQLIKNWHIRFEKIHPFVDGNGRTGRIIMNKQRMRLGMKIKIIHTGKEQMDYYEWFKEKE